jgi:hypothetical protein
LLELDSCGKPEHLLNALELLWEAELDGRGPKSGGRGSERRLAWQGLEWSRLLYSEFHEITVRWQSRLAMQAKVS